MNQIALWFSGQQGIESTFHIRSKDIRIVTLVQRMNLTLDKLQHQERLLLYESCSVASHGHISHLHPLSFYPTSYCFNIPQTKIS